MKKAMMCILNDPNDSGITSVTCFRRLFFEAALSIPYTYKHCKILVDNNFV